MISFDCKCGKRLRTRPEAAGKRVKCPGCGQPVQVPVISAEQAAKTALADARKQTLLDEQPTSAPAGSSYCPKCHVVLLEGAVLCTTCGYDLRTGRVIERKKTLNERIPWGAVRSVLVNLALLAIVVSIGLWAVNRMKTAQQADEQQEKEKKEKEAAAVANRVARKEREKKARFLPLVIALQVNARVDGPAPPDTFSLKCTDGAHTAGEARATLVKKVRQEVYDAFFLKGHRMGGAEAASAADTPPVKLALNADVEVAWTYVTVDKSIVPRAPRITQCSLSLRREGKQPMWLSPKFYDERTTPAGLDTAALARIAKLGGATTGMNFERRADREAALAARRMFAGPGAPGQAALTRFLNADRMAEKAATEAMAALDEQSDGAKARELAKRGNLYLLASLAKRLDA
ncbi:zinc ribbon domain-containing protein, partial [bacterium]|nr:zinc ribbon domain-containing protein [bacterium]